MVGQLLGGFLGDRFDKRLLCSLCMLGHASGLALVAYAQSPLMVVGFALLHGLRWGTRGPLMVALRADYFGATSFGTIMGISSLIVMVGMSSGAIIAGVLADIFGDFKIAFTKYDCEDKNSVQPEGLKGLRAPVFPFHGDLLPNQATRTGGGAWKSLPYRAWTRVLHVNFGV